MDLATIQDTIKTQIAALSGLDTYWEDEPREFVNEDRAAVCLLHLGSIVAIGWDETRQKEDLTKDPGQELADQWEGNREFVVTLKAESYDQTPGKGALTYLEKVREGLWWRSSSRALKATNLVWLDAALAVDLSEIQDDRRVSIFAMDLRFATRSVSVDPERYGWIEKLILSIQKLNP